MALAPDLTRSRQTPSGLLPRHLQTWVHLLTPLACPWLVAVRPAPHPLAGDGPQHLRPQGLHAPRRGPRQLAAEPLHHLTRPLEAQPPRQRPVTPRRLGHHPPDQIK